MQGFEKPYDLITSMGFHFHTDNNSQLGYHVFVYLVLDRFLTMDKHESDLKEILDLTPKDCIYDISIPVYNHYPY